MTNDLKVNYWRSSEAGKARTLIFSQRNLTQILPFRCAHFEFEDVISQVENAEVVSPRIVPPSWSRAFFKQLAYHVPFNINPGVDRVELSTDFELFFAICGGPSDLLRIQAIGDWRRRCRKAICLIDEVWARRVPKYRRYLRMLREFDLVVLYYSKSVEPVNDVIGERKCVFLPPAVDAVRFCPYPDPPKRLVDVYSVGRRSDVTHEAFLRMAAQDGMFYVFDTTSADQVLNPIEHRVLLANTAKRSRYFIVNPGLINRPDVRGNQIEIGNRYFEAAASGSILIGERPRNGEFERFFDWPDALIDMPYDSADAMTIIKKLDAEPDRQRQMRKQNVQQALLRHDWVYRWEEILRRVDVAPLSRLESRKQHLKNLADSVAGD